MNTRKFLLDEHVNPRLREAVRQCLREAVRQYDSEIVAWCIGDPGAPRRGTLDSG